MSAPCLNRALTLEERVELADGAGGLSNSWSALDASPLILSRGRVVGLWFRASSAKRSSSGQRKIDLKFRARLEV